MIRFSSAGWSRPAASGSTARSSASSGPVPSARARAWSLSRQPVDRGAKVRPDSRESRYSPVPPTRMGSFPRARMSSTQGAASSTYRAAEKSSQGSATSSMWWGTPPISSGVGLAVPMSMRR